MENYYDILNKISENENYVIVSCLKDSAYRHDKLNRFLSQGEEAFNMYCDLIHQCCEREKTSPQFKVFNFDNPISKEYFIREACDALIDSWWHGTIGVDLMKSEPEFSIVSVFSQLQYNRSW